MNQNKSRILEQKHFCILDSYDVVRKKLGDIRKFVDSKTDDPA